MPERACVRSRSCARARHVGDLTVTDRYEGAEIAPRLLFFFHSHRTQLGARGVCRALAFPFKVGHDT
eukprot:3828430-Prymnesium_polylepis.1